MITPFRIVVVVSAVSWIVSKVLQRTIGVSAYLTKKITKISTDLIQSGVVREQPLTTFAIGVISLGPTVGV